jgi:PAS domain S-box-containing protein
LEITRDNPSAAELEIGKRSLDEPSERMRAILSLAGVAGGWEWHIGEGRIVGDARFAALYGLSVEEAMKGFGPNRFFSIIHPQDQTRIRLAVGGMLRGAEVFSKDYRLVLGDGAIRWVQARGRSYQDDDGHPAIFAGALVDITDQKRVEEQLRIAQTAGGVGTFEYVDGYGTASVSPQFCALLGLHPARDLPVRTINGLVHPGDDPIIDAAVPPADGAASQAEFRITRPDNGEVLQRRYLRHHRCQAGRGTAEDAQRNAGNAGPGAHAGTGPDLAGQPRYSGRRRRYGFVA